MALYKNTKIIGKGEQTIVLSHGFGASQHLWDNMLSFLQERYQLVLFDWDFSNKAIETSNYTLELLSEALISLLDDLKVEKVIFVGHSMAGMISCIASIRRPDLFVHLLLLGASPRYLNSDDYEGGFERADIEKMLPQITSDFHMWAENMISRIVGVDDHSSIEKLSRSFLAMRPEVAQSLSSDIFLKDRRDVLEKIEIPCTIIGTSKDFAVPVAVGGYMQSKIKGETTLEIIDAEGHCPSMTAHHKLIEVFERVLSSKMMINDAKNIAMEVKGSITPSYISS
ncbi:karrikin insensitive 2 receptor IA-like [Carex rostrata]